MMDENLLIDYVQKKHLILKRLQDFRTFYTSWVSWVYEDNEMHLKPVEISDNKRIFEELTFCLLTANTSAVMGMKGVDALRNILQKGTLEDLQKRLKQVGYRYPNIRSKYIIEARQKNIDFKKLINSYSDNKSLREFFVENIKGLGFKESSHFLRNIGVFGLAILDKHILRTLHEYGYISNVPKSLNKKQYIEIEQKFILFSEELNINMDELDLLLWSIKNGEILK